MYEVEVKVRADHETVRERVAALDADFQGTIRQEDTYYDAPHREFAETDEALRIRRETPVETGADDGDGIENAGPGSTLETDGTRAETTVITYKGPLVDADSKTRHEAETAVEDAETVHEIFTRLGFTPAATVPKRRSTYTATDEEWTIVCDRVEDLGEFVEVELEADEGEIEAARERVYGILRDLDLDPADGIRTSYLGMLLDGADGPNDSDEPTESDGSDASESR